MAITAAFLASPGGAPAPARTDVPGRPRPVQQPHTPTPGSPGVASRRAPDPWAGVTVSRLRRAELARLRAG